MDKHQEGGSGGKANDHRPSGGGHSPHALSNALSLEIGGFERHVDVLDNENNGGWWRCLLVVLWWFCL